MFDIVNHAKLNQLTRPARRHLFRGLEDEFNAAVQLFAKLAQDFRRPHQHRGMRVVTAGVHYAGLR